MVTAALYIMMTAALCIDIEIRGLLWRLPFDVVLSCGYRQFKPCPRYPTQYFAVVNIIYPFHVFEKNIISIALIFGNGPRPATTRTRVQRASQKHWWLSPLQTVLSTPHGQRATRHCRGTGRVWKTVSCVSCVHKLSPQSVARREDVEVEGRVS